MRQLAAGIFRDPVQAAMREALIEASLAGNTTSMGTVQTAVYDANGSYLGQFGGSGGYTIYDQNGGVDSSGVMTDDGVTLADQELAGQLLTFSYDQPIPTSAYTNLRQINQALSAYLIASDNSDPLANAVDIYDSNGNYYGNVGIDQTTGQMAIEAQGGSVVDISAALLAQYGLSASAVESAQQLWAPAGSLTESQATELSTTTTDLGALLQQYSDNPFENMTPAQIAQMSVSELSGFSAGQIYNLTAADVKALSGSQVEALQLSGLTSAAVAALSPAEIAALSPAQFVHLNLGALTTQQLGVVTPAQLAALAPYQVWGFSVAQLNALTAQQLQALNLSYASAATIGGLSAAAFGALTTAQITSLGPNSGLIYGLQYFSATQLQAVNPGTFAYLNSIGHLTGAELPELLPSQIAQIPAGTIDEFSAQQLNEFSVPQIQALNMTWYWQFASLSPSTVEAFTGNQIASLAPWELEQLDASQSLIAGLTPSQVAALTASQIPYVNITYFNTQQLQAITPAAVAGFSSWDLYSLSPEQVTALTPSQLASLSAAQVAGFNATQINAMSAQQIQALNVSDLSSSPLNGLSEASVQAFTTAQVASFSADQIGWLSGNVDWFMPAQIASLSPASVASISPVFLASLKCRGHRSIDGRGTPDARFGAARGAHGASASGVVHNAGRLASGTAVGGAKHTAARRSQRFSVRRAFQ